MNIMYLSAVMDDQTKLPGEQFTGWLLSIGIGALVIIAGTASALTVGGFLGEAQAPKSLIVSMLQQASFILVIPIALVLQRDSWKRIFLLRLPGRKPSLIYGGLFLAYIATLNALLLHFDRTQSIEAMLPFWNQCTGIFRVLFIVNVALFAPLGEEILFRGYLFGSLSLLRGGVVVGAIISTLVWTLLHAQYIQPEVLWPELIGLFTMGILLCVVRAKTTSLWIPVLLHIINNVIGVCVLWVES